MKQKQEESREIRTITTSIGDNDEQTGTGKAIVKDRRITPDQLQSTWPLDIEGQVRDSRVAKWWLEGTTEPPREYSY